MFMNSMIFITSLFISGPLMAAGFVEVQAPPNCGLVESQLKTERNLLSLLTEVTSQAKKSHEKWKKRGYSSFFHKRNFERAVENMEEVSILLHFNGDNEHYDRSIALIIYWEMPFSLDLLNFQFVLPGFYPMKAEQLSMIDNLTLYSDEDGVHLEMYISPIQYCMNQEILIYSVKHVLSAKVRENEDQEQMLSKRELL